MMWILLAVIILIASLFFILNNRYESKLKPISDIFNNISIDDKIKVYNLISNHTLKAQTVAFLVPTGEKCDASNVIKIPERLNNQWNGKSFQIDFKIEKENTDIEIKIIENCNDYSVVGGIKHIPVLVPRFVTKNGKEINSWSVRRLLSGNKELKKLIASYTRKGHVDLLTSILANKPSLINYHEPLFQIRIGDGLQWISSPESVKCNKCKKEMEYLFNIPGSASNKKGYGEFIYYIFSCLNHPEEFRHILQAF